MPLHSILACLIAVLCLNVSHSELEWVYLIHEPFKHVELEDGDSSSPDLDEGFIKAGLSIDPSVVEGLDKLVLRLYADEGIVLEKAFLPGDFPSHLVDGQHYVFTLGVGKIKDTSNASYIVYSKGGAGTETFIYEL